MGDTLRALVTGSTRGIGFAIAEKLILSGYEVTLNYAHDDTRAREAYSRLQGLSPHVGLIRADVTDEWEARRLIAAAEPIDLLVNNVGDFLFKPLSETTKAEWDSIIASNLTGAFLCCREAIPSMRSRNGGVIINIASMNAGTIRPTPHTLPYAIAKGGLIRLTKTLAKTEGRYGIRVNAVCPGFVEGSEHTPPHLARTIPLRRLGTADEIAEAVLFLASDRAAYITGAVLEVTGGALL